MAFSRLFHPSDEHILNTFFKRPESLTRFLPYNEVLPDNIFANKDGSLGGVFEIKLLEHEVMNEEQILNAVNSLKAWFSLSENVAIQIIYEQSPLSPLDKRWTALEASFPESHAVSKLLYEKRLAAFRKACTERNELVPVERKAFLCIRYFPKTDSKHRFFEFFSEGLSTLKTEVAHLAKELTTFRQLLKGVESNSKLKLESVGGAELARLLRRTFNPETYFKREFVEFNSQVSLSDQILYSSPEIDHASFNLEGVKTRTISLKTSPSYAYPGGMAYFTKLNFPFRMALNVSFPSKAKVKRFFDLKEFFLENTPSARAKRQKEEVLEVQNRLAREDRCLHLSFHIVIEGRSDDELDQRTRDILNIFHNDLECELIVEKDIGAALFLNTLPLCYHPKSDLAAQRFIRILRSDATKFIPIFDSFRGLNEPLSLYLSRENNLVKFSLLENETSNHTVILADTGSGKSSFVIDLVQSAKKMIPEPLVFVIDKKSSYTMLSEYFEADITVFDKSGKMPFSPFRGAFDEDKLSFLTQLLVTGIKLVSPSFEIESEHYSIISKAVKLAHIRKLNERGLRYEGSKLVKEASAESALLTMDDVVSELSSLASLDEFEKYTTTIDVITQKLSPFYGDGMYARYFNSTESEEKPKSKLFYVYDLDALDSDPTLQTLMTMAVVEEIRQTIKLHKDEGRKGFVVLEEMQLLGRGNGVGKKFVIDAAETFRKLDVWLISLTPRPQNYFETEVGLALWGVADNFIFMQMSEDNVEFLTKHSTLLDTATKEIVKSLRTIRGEFAEVFYCNKKKTKQGAFKFFQTAYDMWLCSTNKTMATMARAALKAHPEDKWKALDELASAHAKGA